MNRFVRAGIAAVSALVLLLTAPADARAANPPPPRALQAAGIDAHLGYKPQRRCSPRAKPGTTALLKALISTWGGRSSGISRLCGIGATSEHKEGRALDWRMRVSHASERRRVEDALRWLTSNNGEVAYRLGVMYIIWNQRIWSIYYQELGWRKMADRGSVTANHKDHVHISLSWDGGMGQTSWWTGQVRTVPQNGACGTSSFGTCLPMRGRSDSSSWPATTVGPFRPYPSETPDIAGSPMVGLTLTAVPGTWIPEGAALGYQWLRDGQPIPDATGETLPVVAADIGHGLAVRVSATTDAGTVTKTSESTTDTLPGRLPKPHPTPVLTGTARTDAVLSAAPGTWPDGVTLSYRWQRDKRSISGATRATYRIGSDDDGHRLRVRIRASKPGYATVTRYSAGKLVERAAFAAIGAPAITGMTRVGGELRVDPGTWTPDARFRYRWYSDGAAISGATAAGYRLVRADLGRRLTVRVSGSRPGYVTAARTSPPTGAIRPGLTAGTPTISDRTPVVGQRLVADPGDWAPDGVTFRYRWYRGSSAIPGATARHYLVTAADHGRRLRVRVEGSRDDYPDLARRSARTAEVATGRFAPGTVRITGEAAVGGTLTADEGVWTSSVSRDQVLQPRFRYQWFADGRPISGATGRTYAVPVSAAGRSLHVVVAGTGSRMYTARATSATVPIPG